MNKIKNIFLPSMNEYRYVLHKNKNAETKNTVITESSESESDEIIETPKKLNTDRLIENWKYKRKI